MASGPWFISALHDLAEPWPTDVLHPLTPGRSGIHLTAPGLWLGIPEEPSSAQASAWPSCGLPVACTAHGSISYLAIHLCTQPCREVSPTVAAWTPGGTLSLKPSAFASSPLNPAGRGTVGAFMATCLFLGVAAAHNSHCHSLVTRQQLLETTAEEA